MRQSIRGVAAITALAITFGAQPMVAQQGEPATIPTALANALAAPYSEMFGEQPHFVVARTPSGWPAVLRAPAPAKLVGGLTIGPIRSVVYRYPSRVNAVGAWQHLLTAAGFTHAATPGRPRGGFTSGDTGETTSWCGANGVASVQAVDSSATTRSVLVTFVSNQATTTACGPSTPTSDPMKPPLEIPTLAAPFGVEASAEGTGWSGENMHASVHVDTTISADSLIEHYARQLAAAGWQVGKRLSNGTTALQPLSLRDDTGKAWVGALILITTADTRIVTLDMMPAVSERTARFR
jgi:hypothetical protein